MKTFKFKLYNNRRKNKRLNDVISYSGRAKNLIVAIQKRHYKLFGKKTSESKIQAHVSCKISVFKENIARLEKQINSGVIEWSEFDEKYMKMFLKSGYLGEIPSQALQQIATRVENGYKTFFDAKKTKSKRKIGVPGFKAARKYKSFTLKQAGYKYNETGNLSDNKLVLMGENFKFFKSRPIDGVVKTLSVKRNPLGEIFICFSCMEPHEVEVERVALEKELALANKIGTLKNAKDAKKESTARLKKVRKELNSEAKEELRLKIIKAFLMTSKIALGIDFGLKDFLIFDNGKKIASPQFLKRSLKELKIASREFSKKVKGSSNWYRTKLKLARLHEKVANQRLEWARKTAHDICKTFDGASGFIFIEDLNLSAMKKLWGRKISDIAYGIFIQELERIARTKYDIFLIKIGRFEKSTGVCLETGLVKKLELSDREWNCDCGKIHDRDIESSKVIREAGLRLVEKQFRDSVVSPSVSDGKRRAA